MRVVVAEGRSIGTAERIALDGAVAAGISPDGNILLHRGGDAPLDDRCADAAVDQRTQVEAGSADGRFAALRLGARFRCARRSADVWNSHTTVRDGFSSARFCARAGAWRSRTRRGDW